jgi:SAM-dependent methyltransferase/uncharacterized protein YbaR (Trm112 family)
MLDDRNDAGARFKTNLTINPARLCCIECRAQALSEANDALVCARCGSRYAVIENIPVMLGAEDARVSLESSKEADTGVEHRDLGPEDLALHARGVRSLLPYARGIAREIALMAYFSTPGLGRGRIHRTQQAVKRGHEQRSADAINAYRTLRRRQLMLYDGELVNTTPARIRARIAEHVLGAAQRVGAKNVLETGFGDGINFWSMDRFHPSHGLRLTGFDYSFYRTRVARRHISHIPGVAFFNGDGKRMAFPDASFDLAYTVHCLEQIPYDNAAVIREMARVARFVLLVEPFFEQQALAGKLHLKRGDYARNLVDSVQQAGLSVIDFRCLGLGNPYNQAGLLLAESARAADRPGAGKTAAPLSARLD